MVALDKLGRVTEIHVKPRHPPSELVWGCLAGRVSALEGVRGYDEPGAYLDRVARKRSVQAVRFGTEFVDIGTPQALLRHADVVPS